MNKTVTRKFFVWICLIILFITSSVKPSPIDAEKAVSEKQVVLAGSLQTEMGHSKDWDPAAETTKMSHIGNGLYVFSGTLPAGDYEYKIAIGGSWDESYGAWGKANGANIPINLEQQTNVTFYYNDNTHSVTDSTRYDALIDEKRPRVVGDLQPEIGAGEEWKPAQSDAFLRDSNFDNIYTYTATIPKGHYEFKIVLGDTWETGYPASNATLDVASETNVTFFYNSKTHEVSTNNNQGGPSAVISKDKLYHNTRDDLYRQPFGAVSTGESVTLKLRTAKDDVTDARVVMKNYRTGTSSTHVMNYAGWSEVDGSKADFWSVAVTPEEKGVYGYKFIVSDGSVNAEYGEDVEQGGIGKAHDNGAEFFQMTVFDPGFTTPDWMKNAVVYQIFPDRFNNGNFKNDDAKKYARGDEPIEHKDWGELPDNPRLKDSTGYKGDGIWSNDFFGGDIKGIHEKLDYIQSLGANTIYLNPINKAASNHKYDAADFQTIDPMFGTPKEFKRFTQELKKRGMYLILDGVFNHVGDDSIYFDRYGKYTTVGAYEYWAAIYNLMNEKGLTEEEAKAQVTEKFIAEGQVFSDYGFHNWFNIENVKVNEGKPNEHYKYQAWWGFDSLPEIASVPGDVVDYNSELNNEKFADYIFYDKNSVAKSWIKRGASGWRLDVANEVDPAFWREFHDEIKGEKINAKGKPQKPVILGEIWDDASKYFLGDMYDTVMNYRFRGAVLHFLTTGNAGETAEQLKAVREDYPKEAFYSLMNLIGSHDTARAVYLLGGGSDSYERAEYDPSYNHELGVKRLKLAAIFQMGYPGAPTIYYGDEAGVTGSSDPDNRRAYPWNDVNEDLIKHYQALGEVRNEYQDVFSTGDIHTLKAEEDIYAFARSTDDRFAIVAINRSSEVKTIELDVEKYLINGITLTDQLDEGYSVESKSGKIIITIPAMSGRMLVSEDNQTLKRPDAVTDIVANEGSHSVTLSWSAGEGDIEQFKVYQTTVQGGLYKEVATTNDSMITIDGLDNGRKYYFAVTAVDQIGNESIKVSTDAMVPHISLTKGNYNITNLTMLAEDIIDLSKQRSVSADIWIAEKETAVKQAEGLIAKLQMKHENADDWHSYDASYTGQSGESNTFATEFLPILPGSYTYRFAFSTDLGRNWVYSSVQSVTYNENSEDTTAPAAKVSLEDPIQESGQVNLGWTLVKPEDPYMIAIIRNGETIEQIWDPETTDYKDTSVKNGTTYNYQIRVYDQYGNTVTSNEIEVTPNIVMIDVTFKVHAPDYTSLDAMLTIPNSLNGWNTGAWEMSRNGAVTPDWEYTVQVEEGTKITYKYVRDGTWDKEGLTDHTRNDSTDDDISYYGYGATGTDLTVVVQNEGGNKMVIEDTILRWIDKPLVITSPKEGATVGNDTITVKGNAIKEGVLTINGERVVINDDMTFSHDVQLQKGENNIKMHVEPSEKNKQDIFNYDSGAIGKATEEINVTVYH